MLSALGALTSRIRLGTLVSPVTFRHPSQLAKVVATVDHVTGGRVELGMGAGWNAREHAAYGFPFPPVATRYAMLEEQVEIVRRSWTQDTVTFRGQHYELDAVHALPKPLQVTPTLLLGGQANPRGAALAARFADEYNIVGSTLADLPARQQRLDAACEREGRDPASLSRSMMAGCIVGRDDAEVAARARGVIERLGGGQGLHDFIARQSQSWVIGTVEQARERLGVLGEAGLQRVMLQHHAHDDLDQVELIAGELIGT